MDKPLVGFENVTLGYEGQPVITGLQFTVNRGDYICVLGQNGSGKSTTMKALLGFLSPMSGKIEKNIRKNAIGYLPQQQPAQADFPASVWEVVLSGCQGRHRFSPFYTSEDRALAEKNMALMNITHLSSRSFRELSGGQKQRALLARTLCAAEDMILLDEPAAGLDPEVTKELYELVEHINRKEGMTVVMISHDLSHALDSATHVLHLDHCMLYFGPTDEYDRCTVMERQGDKNASDH